MSRLARYLPLLVLLLGLLYLLAPLLPKPSPSAYDLAGFGRLPVLANGRIKPLDSVARHTLLILQGRQKITTPEGRSLTPEEWLLEVFFNPTVADTFQHFEIVHPDLLAVFNLTPELGAAKKRFAYQQLVPRLDELDRQAGLAGAVEAPVRNTYQRAVVTLRDHVILYQQLKHSLVMPDGTDFLGDLTRLQDQLPATIAAVRAKSTGQPHDADLARLAVELGEKFLRLDEIGLLLPIPPAPGQPATEWQKTGRALLSTFPNGTVNPWALTYAGLQRTWLQKEPTRFNEIIRLYRQQLERSYPELLTKTDMETRFNAAAPFYTSMVIYLGGFLLGVIAWLRWSAVLQPAAYYLILLAWLATTLGIATRMWLEGRPPVTNLYSSALFVGWGCVGLALILERIYRNSIGSVTAGMTGFCTLIIAHYLSLTGDTLEMMRAVLDSNFWLATHVVVITIGYSATYLAGFLAIVYVLRGVCTRTLDRPTADALNRMVYGIICFATLFSLVGTILGGIWADQSWGRFWGWDPKENGALIIVMWNALILHARWGGLMRQRGLMCLAIFGNVITSWSWFGVNMLGVGLHSYGFMDAAFWWLIGFAITQLALIALACVPLPSWRSAPMLARPA